MPALPTLTGKMTGQSRTRTARRFLQIAVPAIAVLDLRPAAIYAGIAFHSGDWSGYVAPVASGQVFANVQGTFTIPTLTTAPASGTNYAAYWVGFDGWSDQPVEQCGVASYIESGGQTIYYAWYQFYPAGAVDIPLTVNPGDTIQAEVEYQGGSTGNYNYLFSIDDVTTAQSYSTTASTSSDDSRSSAEWITEAWGTTTLAKFGTVTFSGALAAENSGSAFNPVLNLNQSLASLGPASVEMVQSGGLADLPSEIHSGESFFLTTAVNLTWNNAGAASPTDGQTWDIENNNNWNNGSSAAIYVDGANVTFNDTNNGHYNVTLNTVVSPFSMTVSNNSNNYVFTGSGNIESTGSLSKTGSGTLTLDTVNSFTSGVKVSAGTLIEGVNSALYNAAVTIGGGTVQLGANIGQQQMSSLSIYGSGVLDVTNNQMILTYGSSDPVSTIAGYIKSGCNNGQWNGAGIISSSARTLTGGLQYAVGWADGKDKVVSGLSSGQIELKYTLLGDANLDGAVNGADFSILAANFGLGTTNWDQGNFLFTSAVNGSDFSALAADFGQNDNGVVAAVAPAEIAALDAFAAANGLPLPAVPEPAAARVLALASVAALRSRRRDAENSPRS
jgi:autotransporter-associated beta strand protein